MDTLGAPLFASIVAIFFSTISSSVDLAVCEITRRAAAKGTISTTSRRAKRKPFRCNTFGNIGFAIIGTTWLRGFGGLDLAESTLWTGNRTWHLLLFEAAMRSPCVPPRRVITPIDVHS